MKVISSQKDTHIIDDLRLSYNSNLSKKSGDKLLCHTRIQISNVAKINETKYKQTIK